MPFKDPAKRRDYGRQYMKGWYAANKASQIERNRLWRRAIRGWFSTLKSTLHCAVCGETDPACLDFHHDDPTKKEVSLNEAIWRKHWGKERILAEAAKCTVLCANHHRKLHSKFRG